MKITSSTIVIGLVLFVLGIGLGFILRPEEKLQVDVQDPLIFEPEPVTVQEERIRMLLGSGALDSVCANVAGQVVEVGENVIIITRDQDRLELKVEQDAHISRLSPPEVPGAVPTRETIELGQIRQGEHAGVYIVITEQGELLARGITVQAID